MPANFTKGKVLLKLRDAFGDFLSDQVDLEFRNMRLSSLNFWETVQFQGDHMTLKGAPAFPQGNWQVTIILGWDRFKERGSYKTPDPTGNFQLTFATNAQEGLAIDADLDDHQGIEHAFDVIKHKLTGRDSHPYDIHQILVKFQNIDPGYRF